MPDSFPPVEASCFWFATRPPHAIESLRGDIRTGVAIIGAGFTGLWTALFLKEMEPSLDVVLLEQGVAGYGGSGRNAGMIGETVDHSHELAAAHFGEAEARELARIGRENLDEMERFLAGRGIDAELTRPGQLVVALTAPQLAGLEKSAAFAQRLGLPDWKVLSASETRAELDSPLYLGSLLAPRNGLLHPIKLLDGLRAEVLRRGARIHEKTPVTGLSFSARGCRVQGETGTVFADRVILATNAYSHRLRPELLSRFLPLYDYILVSEPLTAAQRAAIGWRSGRGVIDARTFFNYYRLTSDGRILWGTSDAAYYPGNRVDEACDHSPRHYAALEVSFRRHFPQLPGLRFPYAWGGPICSTTRLTPFFGRAARGRLLYGLGYTGHGLGSTRIAGKILAHMALERRSPLLDLAMVRRKPLPYPPEPLRAPLVRAVTGALRRVDEGGRPSLLLRVLTALGIDFSS